jgi:hypothetical protein
MKIRHPHSAWQVYADVLMCLLMWAMMCVSMLIIQNVQSKGKLDDHPKAEFMVTLDWDNKRNVDLDLWLQDQNGHVIYYLAREANNVALDRDSRGFSTNKVKLEDGREITSDNEEIVTIRAIMPGDYLAAVSYYAGADENSTYSFSPVDPRAPIDAKVKLDKVNPKMTMLFNGTIHFTYVKEAQNVVAFHVDEDGKVTILPLPEDNLIRAHGGAPDPGPPGRRDDQ